MAPMTSPRAKSAAKALRLFTGAPLRTCQQVIAGADVDLLLNSGKAPDDALSDIYALIAAYTNTGRPARASHVAVIAHAILPAPFRVRVDGVDTVVIDYPWASTSMGKRTLTAHATDWSSAHLTSSTRNGDTADSEVDTGLTGDCDDPLWVAKALVRTILGTGQCDVRYTSDTIFVSSQPADAVPDQAVRVMYDILSGWDLGGVEALIRWAAAGAPLDGWDDPEDDEDVVAWLLDVLTDPNPGEDGLTDGIAEEIEAHWLYDRTRGSHDAARDVIVAAVSVASRGTQHPYLVFVADLDRTDVLLGARAAATTLDRAVSLAKELAASTGGMATVDRVEATGTDGSRPVGTQTHVVSLLSTRGGTVRFDHR